MKFKEKDIATAIRAKTRDHMTFDRQNGHRTIDSYGNQAGVSLGGTFRTADGSRTYDSTGAFLVGELERLDLTMHEPLAAVTWGRDIDLREDVTIADEVSSFTLSTFASAGGLGTGNGVGNGKAWIGKNSNEVSGVSLDIAKIPHQLDPWALEIKYSILELESAARLGRPIDTQKFEALQLKHQMDIDEQVYVGDLTKSVTGLCNSNLVTNVNNLPSGVSGITTWVKKTPDEILADVNAALISVWAASGYAVMPSRILIPPTQFGYLSTQKVSTAGNVSVLKYILENNILVSSGQGRLEIHPVKWLVGAGGSTGGNWATIGASGQIDRMVVYTKEKNRVRFPMTLLQRTPIQYDSIYHKSTYFCRLGAVETVYGETLGYFDGI